MNAKTLTTAQPATLTPETNDSFESQLQSGQPPVQRLAISAIKADRENQGRAAINARQVEEYAERMKAGDHFPPLVVFYFDGAYWLADGFHRHQAASQAGLTEFEVEVRQGNRKDA